MTEVVGNDTAFSVPYYIMECPVCNKKYRIPKIAGCDGDEYIKRTCQHTEHERREHLKPKPEWTHIIIEHQCPDCADMQKVDFITYGYNPVSGETKSFLPSQRERTCSVCGCRYIIGIEERQLHYKNGDEYRKVVKVNLIKKITEIQNEPI